MNIQKINLCKGAALMNEKVTFNYANNGDSMMVVWTAFEENKYIRYDVYADAPDGNFKLVGSSTFNYCVFDSKGVSRFYVEAYDKTGKYLTKSGVIDIHVTEARKLNITAVKSYGGVTLNWSSGNTFSNYYVMKKDANGYNIMFPIHMFQLTFDKMDEGAVLKVVECDAYGKPVRLSDDFVFSEDKFDFTPPAEKKLTVVIPVYNNEKFLSICVDAVLCSTMKDLDIIIVDDGSTDSTPEIADWYRDNYPGKITVFHTENQGAAEARNVGIRAAEGEYIAFADSDDLMGSRMYELLYNKAEKYNCDISVGQMFSIEPHKQSQYQLHGIMEISEECAHDTNELLFATYSQYYQTVSMCDKICKTSLVKEHPVPRFMFEDAAFSPVLYSYAKNFCYTQLPLYCYNRNVTLTQPTLSNNMAKMTYEERANDRISAYRYIIESGNPDKREYLMLVSTRLVTRQLVDNFDMPGQEAAKVFVDFVEEYKEEIRENKLLPKDEWTLGRLKTMCEKYNISLD